MKIYLLENQIDVVLKSLENYTKIDPEKLQLINATYESLLYQKCNENVTQKIYKNYLQIKKLCI